MKQISDLTRLREIVGKPHPLTVSKIYKQLDETAVEFIAKASLLFIATGSQDGAMTVSPKGDAPGFVHVVDEQTLRIPERPGNKLLHGLSNILETGRVGLVFLIPGTEETLRINGRCALYEDTAQCEAMAANGKAALLFLEVTVEQCFFHCAKAFKRSKAWQPEQWQSPVKVSFGKQIAEAKLGKGKLASKALAAVVDQAVKSDYKKNL